MDKTDAFYSLAIASVLVAFIVVLTMVNSPSPLTSILPQTLSAQNYDDGQAVNDTNPASINFRR